MSEIVLNSIDLKKEHLGRELRFSCKGEISKQEAILYQIDQGYHPAGYGFHDLIYNSKEDRTYWKCYTSSE